ncbi:IucA/IucC family siderophore biosynthesis protein, partial [Streptomyces sp. ID05-39B]|nr:IucA/IucC family siderophore biosynthesis protein [Streptomyces sp. ID05-39B]
MAARADALAAAPLLNCLLREVAERDPARAEGEVTGAGRELAEPRARHDARHTHRLPSGRLLRVRGARRPAEPEVRVDGAWHRLDHRGLVGLVATELRHHTGLTNPGLPAEMLDSRDAVAALLAARAQATPPEDLYLRSEQSLLTGHPH